MLVSGVLNFNKPPGMTSRAVVDQVTRLLRKIKAGHAGTLDPLASGVLIVCVGSATRLIESVQRMTKVYRTVIRLGVAAIPWTSRVASRSRRTCEFPLRLKFTKLLPSR